MNLIGINKIASHIDKHPEARVPLLMWLKEFPYQQARWNSLDHEGKPLGGWGEGGAGVGTGEYWVKYVANYDAKTHRIKWVGSEEECKIEMERQREEDFQKYPNAVRGTVSVVETIITPPTATGTKTDSFTFTTIGGGISTVNDIKRDPLTIYAVPALPIGEGFQSHGEYEQALSRVSAIFEAKPNTPEFNELLILLPLIGDFENHKLKFPALHNFEIVKNRLEMFQMKPTDLPAIDGGEEQINLFLSGKLELSDEIVSQMFKVLYIRIPIGDKR